VPRALTITLATAGATVALAGCGGGGPAEPAADRTVTKLPAATVQLADCNAWHALRPASRRQLLLGMRGVFGGPVDGVGHGNGEILSDAQANQLLDHACKPRWAGRFKLYKIYGRAAAFTPPQ
jgi:hypothetical protein